MAYCQEIITSNYPIPNNNAQEVYEKTKDLNLVKTLFEQTNDFEKVEIKDSKIYLIRKPVLKNLQITGNKSFWASEIKAITGLTEKYTFDPDNLQTIPLRIRQFYAEKGFLFTSVEVDSKYHPDGFADITLKINEGQKTKLNDIIFLSDQNISLIDKSTFLKVLKLKKGDYIYFDQLENKIENLSKFIKKSGYYDAFVNLQDIDQVDKGYADIYIAINFGTKYTVKFEGNKTFEENVLKKLLTFEENGFNYYELNESKNQIIDFYKGKGFLDVEVSTNIEESEELFNGIYPLFSIINFNIEEGSRYKISTLNIETDTLEIKEKILSTLKEFYDKSSLERILQEYNKKYFNEGFLSVNYKIQEEKKENGSVDLKISFYKGKKYVLEKISQINYKSKIDLKLPKTYNPNEITELQKTLKQKLQEDGFLDGEVLLDVETTEEKDIVKVNVNFIYELNQPYKNGITFVYGSYHLQPKVVKWQLKEKDIYDSKTFDLAISRLYESRLFDYVNPVFMKNEEEKTLDKAIILHDDKRGLLQGSVGYSTDQQFKASVALIFKNLFSYGLESSVYLERSNFQTNYRLSFGSRLLPYYLTSFISAYRNTQYRRYFDLNSQGFDFYFEKVHNKFVKSRLTFESKNNSLNNLNISSPVKSYSQYKISYSLSDDHRNSKIDPKKGYLFVSKISQSFKDINYTSAELSLRLYKDFFDFVVFSPRISSGYIFKNNDSLPASERYFLGGITSLRGFGIDEVSGYKGIGGNSYWLINNDLRFLIYPKYNIYLLTFYDLGNVFTEFKEYKKPKFRETAGIGVYVPTPVGSFILDYAKKLDKKPGESPYRIEFSIGLDF
ncbi:POTRA domain-containing protein [Sulfurihydrogenibium sp.]|uniref:BamA/OMP85 family outer membrane protein n=1 Tax=Sulfurihydrogenibium sp. TaxID=2053621 RepID=UPI0026377E3C|nr:POTRA domain-containing protein [Sulfurihydrogenibium sp.]